MRKLVFLSCVLIPNLCFSNEFLFIPLDKPKECNKLKLECAEFGDEPFTFLNLFNNSWFKYLPLAGIPFLFGGGGGGGGNPDEFRLDNFFDEETLENQRQSENPVPEPISTTLFLVGGGLVAAAVARKRS